MRPRWLWLLAAPLVLLTAGWGVFGYYSSLEKRFQADLGQAKNDLADGRVVSARTRLLDLTARRPSDGEAAYLLGRCEAARANPAAAWAAWEKVPAGSPFATRAAAARASSLVEAGRLAAAESILEAIPLSAGPDDAELRQTLELVYRLQGRMDDVRRVINASWVGAADPPAVLRRLFMLEKARYPAAIVDKLFALADPDDDRVWLAQANRAILSGQLDQARQWLARCEARRPKDPAVWQAYLALAQSANDIPGVVRAMEVLPAGRFSTIEKQRLRVWLAAATGDHARERSELDTLAALDPGDTGVYDRLAELALERGEVSESERLRRRKAEVTAMSAQYGRLLDRDHRTENAAELARLAAELGRPTEARGWSLVTKGLAGREPLDADIHGDRTGLPLAHLFADIRPPVSKRAAQKTLDVGARPFFQDDASAVGLPFVYDNGHTGRRPPPPEAMGGGVGLIDFNGDGWLDVYLVQGGPFPAGHPASEGGDRLFRNKGDGTFDDVTGPSGLAARDRGYGHGVAVADYDNDGRPDLFVTRWRSYALYRNNGDGTFEDATARAGLGGDRDWPTSAAFADLDRDGDLDLYVCHYLRYDESDPKRCSHPDSPGRHECNPLDFDALSDHVFRNDAGRFVDVTAAAGFSESTGRGLGVVAADFDGDDLIDLYVANDMSANYLYRNKGRFVFEEVGVVAGAAASATGGYKAGMGIACGDLDGDGKIDLAVTNYYGESTTFYRNLGGGIFADHSESVGLSAPTRLLLGFGIAFLDVDNDGRLDVLSANGHVIDPRPRFPWMMPLQILHMGANSRLSDVSATAGDLFRPPHLGRGLAAGDLDNDGRLDALAVCQNEPLVYIHNQTAQQSIGHFLVLRLEGTTSNRDAVGASVTVHCGTRRWLATRFGGGSYQSASDSRFHFGIGPSTIVNQVEVRWPTGKVDRYSNLRADTGYRLREGDPVAAPLAGFARK
jgi:predicted Zn-dependent protease